MSKNLNNSLIKIIPVLISMLLSSCSLISYDKMYPALVDGKYDSEFPYRGSSEELENISQTVQRVTSTGFYKAYFFAAEDSVTLEDIGNNPIESLSIGTSYADQSSSGTGTVIYSTNGKVALLTCAHVVNYSDTVTSFFFDESGTVTNFLEAALIKEKQTIYVAGFPGGSILNLLAIDNNLDVALIGRRYTSIENYIFPVFSYPTGKAKELVWGTFVYIFGYPINYQMITKALVSSPNRDNDGSFLVDAVVNQGYSGGIVLAIKDGIPNFELVGLIQWVPKDDENIIVPAPRKNNEPSNIMIPYNGEIFVKKHSNIKYGMAKVISIESILQFLEKNKVKLYDEGFFLENFLDK